MKIKATPIGFLCHFVLVLLLSLLCNPYAIARARTRVDTVQGRVELAAKLLNAGHDADARRLVLPLCHKPTTTCEMYCILAKTYLDDLDQNTRVINSILPDLKLAIKLDPKSGYPYRVLAEYYNLQGDYKQAVSSCEKALKISASDSDALRQLAISHCNLGDYKAALADIDARISYTNTGATESMTTMKGNILEKLNRPQDAIVCYRLSAKKRDTDIMTTNIVRCYESEGKYPDAIVEISRLIKRNPADADALSYRASLQAKLKNYKEAVRDYTRAIELEPSPSLFKSRAAVYKLTGQNKEAESDLLKAKKEVNEPF